MTLYEIKFELPLFFLILLLVYVLTGSGYFIERIVARQLDLKYNRKVRKTSFIIFLVIAVVSLSSMFIYHLSAYLRAASLYKSGDYKVAEGFVENFTSGEDESFDINDIHFSYSNAKITQGYHTLKDKGGVITGDGQYLRIGYVNYGFSSDNIIVYIEELK